MTHEASQPDDHFIDELVAMDKEHRKLVKQDEHRMSSAQQQAALRALKGAGVTVARDTVIDVRGPKPKVGHQAPANNGELTQVIFPQFTPATKRPSTDVDVQAFNEGLDQITASHNLNSARQANRVRGAVHQSRFASFRARMSERLRNPSLALRRTVGAVALVGVAFIGGVVGTAQLNGNSQPIAESATTSTTYEAPTTTSSTIVAETPEAVITIDLSNAETADALGRLITGNEIVRQSMGPGASETEIQEAQLRTLQLAVALEAAQA